MATFDLASSARNLGQLRVAVEEAEVNLRGILHLAAFQVVLLRECPEL